MRSPIDWPDIGEETCHHFTLFALFGNVDPRNIRTQQTPASELKSRVIAAGTEPETFTRIQPVFHQDNKLALILETTRKGFFDGKEPQDHSPLPELLRRTEAFVGDSCRIQVIGDYFLPEWCPPEPLRIVRGPYGTSPSFTLVNGQIKVEGSSVQLIQWALREDALWKITLTGWLTTTLDRDIMQTSLATFHETFRAFRDAKTIPT
jgi:hypothetical protein